MRLQISSKFVFAGVLVACNATNDDELARLLKDSVPAAKAGAPITPQQAGLERPVSLVRGISRPLLVDTADMAIVDRLDVGNEPDERAHQYSIENPTYRGMREFEIPNVKASYSEDGRGMKNSETFHVKVVPWRDNLLVKACDTLAADQKVRVSVDGKPAGDWPVPDGGSSRYGEAMFALPASLVGDRSQLNVRIDYVSGTPDTNAFVYWVLAKPSQTLDHPLSIITEGLTLMDQLNVGGQEDEAAHDYVIDRPTFAGIQQFEVPASGLPFLENGRATKTFETFRMKVTAGKDHLLVKAFDTYSKGQVVRVFVGGTVVGDWTLPNGEPRYAEGAFRIPAKFIGLSTEVLIRIELVSASADANSFRYWMFADPSVRNG